MVFCLPAPTPRYEDEINKRTAAENDFVVLKKVSQAELQPPSLVDVALSLSRVFSLSLPVFVFLGSTWNCGIKGSG